MSPAELAPYVVPVVTALGTVFASVRAASKGGDEVKDLKDLAALHAALPAPMQSKVEALMARQLADLAHKRTRQLDVSQVVGFVGALLVLSIPIGFVIAWAPSLPWTGQIIAYVGAVLYALILAGAALSQTDRLYQSGAAADDAATG